MLERDAYTFLADGRIRCACNPHRPFARSHKNRHVNQSKKHRAMFPRPIRQVQSPARQPNMSPPSLFPRPNIDPDPEKDAAQTILENAIILGNTFLIEYAINALGANVDGWNSKGRTPLICAMRHQQPEALLCLLECGADINATGRRAGTAVNWGAYMGYTTGVSLMLAFGANTTIMDSTNRTPLDWAKHKGYLDLVTLLDDVQYSNVLRDCEICYETRNQIWSCSQCIHVHCKSCHNNIQKSECPCCRKPY